MLSRLSDLRVPGLAGCPRIRVDLIESEDESFDPGEIGVPAVAPALAAAIQSATGLKLRTLPFDLTRAVLAAPVAAPVVGVPGTPTAPADTGSLPSAAELDNMQPDAGAADQ